MNSVNKTIPNTLPSICVLCMKTYSNDESILLPCGHYFHSKCIAPFVSGYNMCPLHRFKRDAPSNVQEGAFTKEGVFVQEGAFTKAPSNVQATCHSVDDMLYGYIPLLHLYTTKPSMF